MLLSELAPLHPGCEVKIDHVAGRDKPNEGEVCFRGRHVMMGYMNNPEKTAETIDADGYLHSGDVGCVDPATNMLRITVGRCKLDPSLKEAACFQPLNLRVHTVLST